MANRSYQWFTATWQKAARPIVGENIMTKRGRRGNGGARRCGARWKLLKISVRSASDPARTPRIRWALGKSGRTGRPGDRDGNEHTLVRRSLPPPPPPRDQRRDESRQRNHSRNSVRKRRDKGGEAATLAAQDGRGGREGWRFLVRSEKSREGVPTIVRTIVVGPPRQEDDKKGWSFVCRDS